MAGWDYKLAFRETDGCDRNLTEADERNSGVFFGLSACLGEFAPVV